MQDKDFDKSIHGKLAGNQAAFNPADWDNMEAMLDDDKPLAAWWFPVAILLLGILIGGTGVFVAMNYFNNHSDEQTTHLAIYSPENFSARALLKSEISNERFNDNDCQEELFAGLNTPLKENAVDGLDLKSDEMVKSTRQPTRKTKDDEATQKGKKRVRSKLSESRYDKVQARSYHNSQLRSAGTAGLETNNEPILFAGSEGFVYTPGEAVNPYGALPLTSMDAAQTAELLEDASRLKNTGKNLITMSFGAFGGMGLSFTKLSSLKKPGYEVGLRQELIFIDRIGLSLSESFNVSNYHFRDVVCENAYYDCPQSIDLSSRSMDFLVDIKANILSGNRWNYYLKVGYGNVFVLDDKVNFSYNSFDTISPPPSPTNSSFTGTLGPIELDQANLSDLDMTRHVPEASLEQNKKYRGYYHFASGLDVYKNQFHFQLEMGYKMYTKRNSAFQNRTHSVGLNAAIFYKFSK